MLEDKNSTAISEVVPEALRYSAGAKSSVISQRTTVKYYPTTGTQVQSDKNRTTIFRLSASDFLDPRTTVLQFKLHVNDPQIRFEDLYTTLIQSLTCQIGGVETSHQDNFGEAFKMMAYSSCPEHIYKTQWNANMGAWKYCPRPRYAAYNDAGPVDLSGGNGGTAVQIGYVCDSNSYPMSELEHKEFVQWDNVNRGVTVSIPLAELFGEFRLKTFVPLLMLGSIDVTVQWAEFNKACIVGAAYNMGPNGEVTANTTAVAPADQVYYIDDLCIHTDLVTLDPTYTKLLQGLVSSSSQGLVMPYESYSVMTRSFINSGTNSIYLNKGLSYLKRIFWGLRCQSHVNSQYTDKSQFRFADAHRAHQVEVGGRLFPENRVTDLATAYVELQKACDQQGSIDAGGLLDYKTFCGRSLYAPIGNTRMPYCPQENETAIVEGVHRQIPQAFITGQNFERALGSGGLLSGYNLKVSGYAVMLNLEMATTPLTGAPSVPGGPVRTFDDLREPNGELYNKYIQLLVALHHDKSLVLRADAVSVSE
jgi:hypothetical protein